MASATTMEPLVPEAEMPARWAWAFGWDAVTQTAKPLESESEKESEKESESATPMGWAMA